MFRFPLLVSHVEGYHAFLYYFFTSTMQCHYIKYFTFLIVYIYVVLLVVKGYLSVVILEKYIV